MGAEYITIRSLQHYLYCPHRWGLIEIDNSWKENYFVVRADLIHERVHEFGHYSSKCTKVYTNVSVWHDEYELYGKLDCLELKNGAYTIVEYKPRKPKNNTCRRDDLLQLYAQKKCLDYVFGCDCDTVLYYADVKKRVPIDFKERNEEFEKLLMDTIEKINTCISEGNIPPKRDNQDCRGCSMADICIPKVLDKKNMKIRTEIMKSISE